MLYGITGAASASGGLSAAAVGITGADMLHVGIGHDVKVSTSAADPMYIYASGGTSGLNTQANLLTSTVLYGISSGNSAAPFGMTGAVASGKGSLFVSDIDGRSAGRDSISIFGGVDASHGAGNAGGTYNIPWVPALLMGCSGASAAGVGMSGDAINVNMVNAGITVDVTVGTSIEVSNDTGGPLYIAGASGASGSGSLLPVTVAGNYQGTPVFVQGTGGMVAVEVRGSSGSGYFPVGVTGNADYSLATDENLNLLGVSLDNLYNLIANGLGDDSSVGTPNNKFATEAQMQAMRPAGAASVDRIANEKEQKEMEIHLRNISSAYGATADSTMAVSIKDFPQPTQFVGGQKACSASSTVLASDQGLSSGVKLKGHQNNSNFVYVGVSGVNVDTGYPLGPSEEVFLEIDNINKVYVMSSPAGQTACFIAS